VEEGLGLPSPDQLAVSNEDSQDNQSAQGVVEGGDKEAEPVVEEPHSKPTIQEPSEEITSDASYGGFLTGLASAVSSDSCQSLSHITSLW